MSLLPKAERRTCLEKTTFITLPVAMLNKMIVDPKEGMVNDFCFVENKIYFS